MADSDYSRHCTDYRNIPNDRTKKIRNAYGADDSYVVRLNLYDRRRYEVIYYGGNFRGAYLMPFMQMWFLGREYMKDKEKYLWFKGKFLNKMEKRVQVLLFGELKLAMQYK